MGRVMRCSTSLAVAPGMRTNTSTMGTMIWGSSSLGSATMAATPSRMEAMMISGVSFDWMKKWAIFPAGPSCWVMTGPPLLHRLPVRWAA